MNDEQAFSTAVGAALLAVANRIASDPPSGYETEVASEAVKNLTIAYIQLIASGK